MRKPGRNLLKVEARDITSEYWIWYSAAAAFAVSAEIKRRIKYVLQQVHFRGTVDARS